MLALMFEALQAELVITHNLDSNRNQVASGKKKSISPSLVQVSLDRPFPLINKMYQLKTRKSLVFFCFYQLGLSLFNIKVSLMI